MGRAEGSITPLEKGRCTRWKVRWYDPIASEQAGGKRVYPSKTVHGTKQDAQRFLRKQLDAKDRGRNTKPSKVTVWVSLDAWLKAREQAGVIRAQTVSGYRETLECHVKNSTFGALKLGRASRDHVAAFYATLKTPALKRRVHVLLRAGLEWALERGDILSNPTSKAELPRHEPLKRTALTEDQVARLYASAYDEADKHRQTAHDYCTRSAFQESISRGFAKQGKFDKAARCEQAAVREMHLAEGAERAYALSYQYFALWQLSFSTGIRPSEALALRWADLDGGRLYVRRSRDKKGRINKPKSKKGERDFALHGPTLAALETHRKNQRAQIDARRAAGKTYQDDDYIFATQAGRTLDWVNVRNQRWAPLVERTGIKAEREAAGLDAPVPYLARHTHATILSERGTQVTAIASRLGHKPKISVDNYIGSTVAMEQLALTVTAGLTFTPKPPMVPS